MKSTYIAGSVVFLLIASPAILFAAEGDTTIKSIVATFTSAIVQATMGLFIAVAAAGFFYGIVRYIWGIRQGDEEKVRTGNTFIIWSLVALFVMTSSWGIVRYAQNFFGLDTKRTIVIPNSNIR
jgi:succinate dehydrogenase/fumarate reductase cytochrome b subunit